MSFSKGFLKNLPDRLLFRDSITAREWMTTLFERTDEDGILHICSPYAIFDPSVLTCKMDWDAASFAQAAEDFERLHAAIEAIAPHEEELSEEGADPAAILQDEALLQVYNTYMLPLDEGDFDYGKIYDIHERLECQTLLRDMETAAAHGAQHAIDGLEQVRADYGDISVSEEELAYMDAYDDHMERQAALRVGDGCYAYTLCVGARRLARLYRLGAPAFVLQNERCNYATVFLLHRHATSVEETALTYEEKEVLTEDE